MTTPNKTSSGKMSAQSRRANQSRQPGKSSADELIGLETKFWDAIVAQDSETAVELLQEPALMVGSHGAFKFDRNDYRRMAKEGSMVVNSYELSNVDVAFPNDSTAVVTYRVKEKVTTRTDGKTMTMEMNDSSTWVRDGDRWLCAIHTETPAESQSTMH